MPGLVRGDPQNTCIPSSYEGCARQAYLGVFNKTTLVYSCDMCSPRYKRQFNSITSSNVKYSNCIKSQFEGCVDGSRATSCYDLCDWRIGYQTLGREKCEKR
jgi:hypothetical protein